MVRFLKRTASAAFRPGSLRPRRFLGLLLFLPPFLVLQGIHWIGLLLDEILFAAYRRVAIREPLFIVGLPRSGTSFLQEVLAEDGERFTTMRLWELLLAPSIVERKILLGMGRIAGRMDRLTGGRLGRGLKRLEGSVLGKVGKLGEVHPTSLLDGEEDYLLLLPIFACFLLVLPFPNDREVWRLTRFDELPEKEKDAILSFFEACVRRHLYVMGPRKRLLSKNPSFTSAVGSLSVRFPDARVICCVREPAQCVPSLLSSLRGGARFFGWNPGESSSRDRFLSMMAGYSRDIMKIPDSLPDDRHAFMRCESLAEGLEDEVTRVYDRFGWTASGEFGDRLADRARAANEYRSRHHYRAEEFGLSADAIGERFARMSERFGYPVVRTPCPSPASPRRPLRVAVVTDAAAARNGVGTYYDDLVHHLRGRGSVVEIVGPPEGTWSLPMPGDPTQGLFVPWPPRLFRRIRAVDPDVVIGPTPGLFGLTGMAWARRAGVPYVVAYHTDFPELARLYWPNRNLLGRVSEWTLGRVDAAMFRRASAILVHNRRLEASLAGRGAPEAALVGTPAPASFIDAPLRPLRDEVRSLTFVGRLAPEKRIEKILAVARALPDTRLHVVGDGPLRSEVEACAASGTNVTFHGWVERPRVMEVLDDSDLLLLPSRRETFGTAAYEAMIRRRCVLVSPDCGIAQWPQLAAGLFRIRDGEALIDAVCRIRSMDGEARRRVAEAGRTSAVDLSRRTVSDWERTLRDLASPLMIGGGAAR